jgi:hypothetical protein
MVLNRTAVVNKQTTQSFTTNCLNGQRASAFLRGAHKKSYLRAKQRHASQIRRLYNHLQICPLCTPFIWIQPVQCLHCPNLHSIKDTWVKGGQVLLIERECTNLSVALAKPSYLPSASLPLAQQSKLGNFTLV